MNLATYFREPGSLTQQQVADIVGCSQSVISLYSTGKRRPDSQTALRISEATGGVVSVSELLAHAIPDGYELRKIDQDDAQDSRREAGA